MQTLEEQVRQLQNNTSKMPKNITLEQATRIDDVQSILKAIPSYKDNKIERFAKGAISGFQGLADVAPSIKIYGQQADIALGGYFGAKPEQIERKALNLATSYRNLQAAQQRRYQYSNPEDVDSFAYGLGQGAFNYGLMLVGGGIVGGGAKALGATAAREMTAKTAAGLSANALLENVEQQSERMPLNENNEVDIKQITPEWARKSVAGTTAYLGVSTILEKGFGFGKQVKMWETPVKTSNRVIKISSPVVKMAGKTALSEGATEGLQSLSSTGILLVEGKIDTSQLPDRLKDAWKEAVIGGILGGASGTAVSINQAHNVKTMLNDEISKVVTDPEECEKVVDAIYESGTIEMTNVISKELELSSELNTKHGAIYDNMQGAIFDAINNAGAFQGVEESELAQYVSETSKMFANQVLAEANKRGVLIDEVLKAGDIKFENGKIQLKSGGKVIAETPVVQEAPEETVASDIDFEKWNYEQAREFAKKIKKDFSDGKNKKGYKNVNRDFQKIYGMSIEEALGENVKYNNIPVEIDGVPTSYEVPENFIKDKKLNKSGKVPKGYTAYTNGKAKASGQRKTVYVKDLDDRNQTRLFQEANKLYQEMQDIDKTGTPYNEPTININGVERPTTNSEGNAIAKTKEAIEHFYKWFGDSKVVDEEGRPLVVYHGSVNTFEIFDKGKASPEGDMGAGFYFTSNEEDADSNYHGGGPDFDNKVARRAEQIQQEREEEGEDIDYEEAKELAEKELKGEPMQFSVYLKIENPCNTDSLLFTDIEDNIDINEEDFETEEEYYEERDYQLQNEIDNVLDYAEREFGGVLASYNYDEERQNIFSIITDAIYNGGISVTGLKQSLNELYLEDENGNMVANEVLRAIIESLGYDGIIDESVSQKFNMNIPAGTTHYIAFNPTQIKSVDNQGTFDINDPNIYHQLKNNPKEPKKYRGAYDVSAKAIELFKDADYSTLPHELAHFWLDNMWQFSRSGKASEAYMNNFNGVLDWLGVKDGQINLTRAQQEKFARGYEKYLYNGYAPSGLVQGAFDDYDRWLQKVYKDAKELRVKLNADAIEFFDTMTTGELPEYDVPETQAEIREKNIEQINKDIETARKFVVEKQEQYNNYDGGNVITENTVPVTTEGEKKQSRAYTNQAAILGIAEELDYNRANIEEQNKLATEFVKNNLDEARQVVNGQKEAPSNILKNAIYNAYLKEMLAIGDNEAYINALRNQSLELTRAGQEIASQRGAIENIFDSGYWIRRIENLKKSKLASEKFGSGWTATEQEQALSRMNNYIKNKVDAVMEDFMAAKPEEQKKIAEKLSKEIAAEFKQKPDTTLYQSMREPSELRTRTNAYNYLYRYINGALGLELTRAQSNEIIAKTQAIQKSIETTRNRNGNPSALFFKNISEMETYANSIEPSPALAILTSTVGRGNMLFSPKTIALNIESNIVNFFTESITRRLQTGAVEMSVDPQVIKDYLAYSREVFNTSGYQVSSMPTLDPTTQILSEKMTTTGGNRLVDKVGRFFEQSIFKYGLGAPDLFFKDMSFVDTANLLATKEANGDSKKATELFKDICLIEPKTAKGKELREIAINESLVATYQNQGKTSDLALGIRNAINKTTGSLRAGDLLSPFVKTPANVIGLGFDYSMGGLVALKNIQTIYNDIQNGTFTDTTRKSLRSLARNGIGFFAAMLIAGMLDEDDYIPEYALLSQKERELVKLRGGVFNSIKIGNKYISLDYFGPLAMPLVSYLNARRADNAKDVIWNYFQGSAYQALKLPVVGDIKSLLEGTGRTLTQDADSNIKMAEDAMIDFVASRSIPAIVTDIAKMTDEFERETNNDAKNRLISKLPVLREELPMQYNYGTGRARETQNPINVLLAGARVKDEVTSPVIRELNRLDKTNAEEKVNLAKVTKSGKLSELSDTQKIDVERKFAQRYATEVNNLIQSNYYPTLDNSGKVKAINKIRDKVRDDIKIEYGLKQPPKPKRRYRRKR